MRGRELSSVTPGNGPSVFRTAGEPDADPIRRGPPAAAGPIDRDRMLLDFAMSQSPAVLYLGTLEEPGLVHFVSSNAQQVIGHPAARLLGCVSVWRDLVHPEDRAACAAATQRLVAEGQSVQEYRLRRPDGRYVWVRDQLRLTSLPGDPAREYVGCLIDVSREKDAQAELRRVNALRRAIIETSMVAVVTMDADGLVIDVNPVAQQMFGCSGEEAEGTNLCDLIVAEPEREHYRQVFARYRARGVSSVLDERMEISAARRDGGRFPAEIVIKRVCVDDAPMYVAEIRDLSERMAAEATQRRLMQMLRDAVDSMPAGFALSDPQGRVVLCNRALSEECGCPPEDLVGWSHEDLMRRLQSQIRRLDGHTVEAPEAFQAQVTGWLLSSNPAPVEAELNSGEWRLIAVSPTSDGGRVTIRHDITKLKRAELALRDGEALIRQVLEACPAPVSMTHAADGLIIYESPAAQALFERGQVGGPVYATDFFVDRRDRDRYVARLRQTGSVDGFEVELKRSSGEPFRAAISARMIEWHGTQAIVSAVYDLTERHSVEAEMARQREALHQSEKLAALGELLASVAHELNNPLSVVVGQALLLQETARDGAIADRAARIGNAADRCARIIRTFLAMARQQPAERRPLDVNALATSAVEMTAYSLQASNIDVKLSLAPGLPQVEGDSDQLKQVVTNLILNAQKALEETDGWRRIKITTRLREKSREIVLKVKDNGPGIPEGIRSRIFEPFFTTRQVAYGTGIGLAFCHRIITTHGGTIEAESSRGEGATMVVRLPAVRARPLPATDVAEPLAASTGPARILVADDDVAVAELLADILREDGHGVVIARSGSDALERVSTADFDLILSDLRMPDLDGPAMFAALVQRRPELAERVAFVTGDTLSPRIREFLAAAGRPCIEKPLTPREVRATVRRLIDLVGPIGKE
ncbi:PAS domain S-box-containing protein [Tepidamorphus gemmatus]|uniref:histidine kinase n=2 Tax=Tepidamorphus gemmatus TaxID=747076 RepID=A0A4R3M870_9HYPH|nr:PAS domain S-box-containing protein [Tepidamorphus gemmatus]